MSDLGVIGGLFAIFCRVGCCFMLMPGLSSTRTPASVRLLLALGISLAVSPLLVGSAIPRHAIGPGLTSLAVLCSECLVGFSIGLAARCMLAAVLMACAFASQVSGFSQPFVTDEGHGEPASDFGALLSSGVVALLFGLDLHYFVIEAVLESYSVIRFGSGIDPLLELDRLSRTIADSLRLALGLSVPFVVASVLINLAFGMLNRMAPQVPVFFISSVFLIGAMLWLGVALLPGLVRLAASAIIVSLQRI